MTSTLEQKYTLSYKIRAIITSLIIGRFLGWKYFDEFIKKGATQPMTNEVMFPSCTNSQINQQ